MPVRARPSAPNIKMLDELHKEILNCRKCELYKTRKNVVLGEGNPKTKVMFVGEAPGAEEDRQGKPFVGAAGKLLVELLNSIKLSRSDVFIGNVLKCRPPENRNPLPEEIETCQEYLFAQIAIIKPKIICTLGNFALKCLIDKNMFISKVHGQVFEKQDIIFIPMYHPAAMLHKNSETMHKIMLEDFKKIKKFLE